MASFFAAKKKPLESLIDAAIDGSNDLGLQLEICDLINANSTGPAEAIRTLKKRLQPSSNPTAITALKTLSLAETCAKNCGEGMHIQFADREFLAILKETIVGKRGVSTIVRTKTLQLIQMWSDGFRRNEPRLQPLRELYLQLRSMNIEFPAMDLDTMAPIFSPEPTCTPPPPPPAAAAAVGRVPNVQTLSDEEFARQLERQMREDDERSIQSSEVPIPQERQSSCGPALAGSLYNRRTGQAPPNSTNPASRFQQPRHSPQQPPTITSARDLDKIRKDLIIVKENTQLLEAMLIGTGWSEDLMNVASTCRAMHQRIIELLDQITNEEVMVQLIGVNDTLQTLLSKYVLLFNNFHKQKQQPGQATFDQVRMNQSIHAGGVHSNASSAHATDFERTMQQPMPAEFVRPMTSSNPMPLRNVPPQRAPPVVPVPQQVVKMVPMVGESSTDMPDTDDEDDSFDMFAQNRNVTYSSRLLSAPAYASNEESGPTKLMSSVIQAGGRAGAYSTPSVETGLSNDLIDLSPPPYFEHKAAGSDVTSFSALSLQPNAKGLVDDGL